MEEVALEVQGASLKTHYEDASINVIFLDQGL